MTPKIRESLIQDGSQYDKITICLKTTPRSGILSSIGLELQKYRVVYRFIVQYTHFIRRSLMFLWMKASVVGSLEGKPVRRDYDRYAECLCTPRGFGWDVIILCGWGWWWWETPSTSNKIWFIYRKVIQINTALHTSRRIWVGFKTPKVMQLKSSRLNSRTISRIFYPLKSVKVEMVGTACESGKGRVEGGKIVSMLLMDITGCSE